MVLFWFLVGQHNQIKVSTSTVLFLTNIEKLAKRAQEGKPIYTPAWLAIKRNCPWIIHLHSIDDEVVSVDEGRKISKNLNSEYHEMDGKGHFTDATLPELVSLLSSKLLMMR